MNMPGFTAEASQYQSQVSYRTFSSQISTPTLTIEPQAAPPSGSYQQTCKIDYFAGDALSASCRDRAGNFRPSTRLELVSQCFGDISNDDGALRCNRGGFPPQGSYLQSCERTFVAGTHLTSVCRRRDGQMNRTLLAYFRQCAGDIHNEDGFLACDRGEISPPGSYTESCVQMQVSAGNLFGWCSNRRGHLVRAWLNNFRQCTGDINNNDGVLNCNR